MKMDADARLESLGFQTMYEKISRLVRKSEPSEPISPKAANQLKRDIHRKAREIWGKNYTEQYEAFKGSLFGEKISAANMKPDQLQALERGLSELDAAIPQKVPEIRYRTNAWSVTNPIYIFEELGPEWKRPLYDRMQGMEELAKREHLELRARANQFKENLPRQSETRIGDYAISQQRNGPEILKAMGVKTPKLTPKEMAAYEFILS